MSLEDRVAALEAKYIELSERLTDAHTLAAHADRDVSEFRLELRNQTELINLTRLDMRELRGEIGELGVEMGELRGEVRGGFEALTRLLERLDTHPDSE